jgi:hypothetical protein
MYAYLVGLALFGGDLERLGADEFAVREAAETRLSRHAWLAAPLCRWPFQDPERRRRAQRVVRRYEGRVNPPGGVWPCIGALTRETYLHETREGRLWIQPYCELTRLPPRDPGTALACIYGRRAHRTDVPRSEQAREATRLFIADLARLGLPVSWQQRLVDWMARREANVIRRELVAAAAGR